MKSQSTHCQAGHEMLGDNVVYRTRRRRCRTCEVAQAAKSYQSRKSKKLGIDTDGLSQTVFETVGLGILSSKIELLETIAAKRKAVLMMSELYASRAESKAARLYKRMTEDQENYDDAVKLYQQASETYERRRKQYVLDHSDDLGGEPRERPE